MKKLSIIIPAFNAEQTISNALERCLRLSSEFSLELIIVDDCSNDSTFSVISSIAKNDSRIFLYRTEKNSGPGVARNIGVDHSTGDYLMFLDADDYINIKAVENCLKLIDTYNADVLVTKYNELKLPSLLEEENSNYSMSEPDKNIFESILNNAPYRIFSINDYPKLLETTNFPWNKICRRDFYISSGIKFPSLRLNEDILPHWKMLLEAKRVILTNESLVNHFVSPFGSNATNDKSDTRFDAIHAIIDLAEYLKLKNSNEEVSIAFLRFSTYFLLWAKSMLPDNKKLNFTSKYIQLIRDFNLIQFEKLISNDSNFRYAASNLIFSNK